MNDFLSFYVYVSRNLRQKQSTFRSSETNSEKYLVILLVFGDKSIWEYAPNISGALKVYQYSYSTCF